MNIPKSSCLFVRQIQVYLTNYTTKLWIFQANTKSDPDNRSGCRGRLCYMYFWWNKSRRSLAYHQFRRNCISSTRSVASHQAAGGFMHGYAVMIYHRKAMDDIQPRWGWWYAKPAAWIKKEVTFGRQKLLLFWYTLRGSNPGHPD